MRASSGPLDDLHPAIRQIAQRASEFASVERVILFGSRARRQHDPRADIDLAIECPTASAGEWARIWALVDDAPTLLAIDLVRFEEAPAPLRGEIERHGVTLYDRRQG